MNLNTHSIKNNRFALKAIVLGIIAILILSFMAINFSRTAFATFSIRSVQTAGRFTVIANPVDGNTETVDESTWTWFRYQRVDGSGFGCQLHWQSLGAESNGTGELGTLAATQAKGEDREMQINQAQYDAQKDVYKAGTGNSIDDITDGLPADVLNEYKNGSKIMHVCFRATSTEGTPNGFTQEIVFSTTQSGGGEGGGAQAGKTDGVGSIADAGPTEDILFSLFLIGVVGSVICVRVWNTGRKQRRY